MGKRTKHQVKEFAQLTLHVHSDDKNFNEHHCNDLPTVSIL